MDMRMVTLENGWTGVVADNPSGAGKPGSSGFAAELDRVAGAAKRAEASGDVDLKAAYDRLSADAEAVLERIKAGASDISKREWNDLRRELKELGLIAPGEFADSDPNKTIVGYMDASGNAVSYPFANASTAYGGGKSDSFWGIDWDGDPFQYLDKWLDMMRGQRDNLDILALKGGPVYDTSHLTRQIEANEKIAGLVKDLLECC